jgi:hypothetical protein
MIFIRLQYSPKYAVYAISLTLFLLTLGCGGSNRNIAPVVVPPVIETQPVSQTVIEGGNVSFMVAVSGTATTYKWYKNKALLSAFTSSTLTINPVTPSDAGTYYVVVSNLAGSVTSASINLVVTKNTGS